MKIGIVGSGAVGGILGQQWGVAGHHIMFSSRHPEQLEAIAALAGANATTGTPEQAAVFGDPILFAVNYASIDDATRRIAPFVAGKIVIDATNPLVSQPDGRLKRMIGDDELALEVMAKKLPGAHLVKAFTTMWSEYLKQNAHRAGELAAVPYASDHEDANSAVDRLIRDAGFEPLSLGRVSDSRPLDPPSPIWNKVLTVAEILERLGGGAIADRTAMKAGS